MFLKICGKSVLVTQHLYVCVGACVLESENPLV